MLNIKPRVAAKWVEVRWREHEPRSLRDILTDVLTTELRANARRTVSDEEISETAEALVTPVARELGDIAEEYILQGIDPSFEIDLADLYYTCKQSPELDLRNRLVEMTPKGFEHFCKQILEKMLGHATVSGGPNDMCVDFFAVGIPLAGSFGPFPSTSRLVVIGQAKKWKLDAEVSERDLREFIGAATLRADDLRKSYLDRYGLLTPVSYAYWITCEFSLGARQFADRMGLWHLNGKALSQLALRTGVSQDDIPRIEAALLARPIGVLAGE